MTSPARSLLTLSNYTSLRWDGSQNLEGLLLQPLFKFARASASSFERLCVKNRRRLHRCALNSGRVTRRNSQRPRAPARIALGTRTNLQTRDHAKLKQRFGGKTIRDVRFRVR